MIISVSFYELTTASLEKILPRFAEKLYTQKVKAVIRTETIERVEALCHVLWTYRSGSFLPHGTAADGYPDAHPFWITAAHDNPANAPTLILVDKAQHVDLDIQTFTRFFYFFDGNVPEERTAARTYWTTLPPEAFERIYWKQTSEGQWNAEKNDPFNS